MGSRMGTRVQLWKLFCVLVALRSLAAAAERVPVVDAAASRELLRGCLAPKTVLVSDLARADDAKLFEATPAAALPPGRYRLHACLALAPVGDIVNSTIEISLRAGQQSRGLTSLHFPVADEFGDFTLDVTQSRPEAIPVSVAWAFRSEEAKKARVQAAAKHAPKMPTGGDIALDEDDEIDEEGEEDLLQLEIKGGRVPLADARQVKYRLMLSGVHIEPLSPVVVETVRSKKVVYRPGERGQAAVTLRNVGTEPERVKLTVALLSGLNKGTQLGAEQLVMPPGSTREWQGEFETAELYWGCELRAGAETKAGLLSSGSDWLAVASDHWDVALIAAHPAHTAHFNNRERAVKDAERLRQQGFTGFEAFFWAPCDFIDFTPDDEKFFSGQTAYPGTITGTKNIIEACHEHGMVATVYSNLWGGSGPPVYREMQRHPEWFGPVSFNTYVLDDWDLMGAGRIRAPGIAHWCNASLRLNPSDDTFRRHAQELIDSHKMFGWDGVRYDSFYTRYWNLRALSIVRPMVRDAIPDFLFGYNSYAAGNHRAGALDVMVGGGGMVMAEAIRIERTNQYGRYASELHTWRDIVWPYGGHIGPLYHGAGQETVLTPLDQIVYSSIILATGAHPYYHELESEIGQHQRFAKRYSEFIYNNRMRPLKHPEQVIAFGQNARFFLWARLARTATLGGNRRRLVVHLLNAPEDGKPAANLAMARPRAYRDLPVTLKLPAGSRVSGAWALKAFPSAHHKPVLIREEAENWVATVDEVVFYTVLVVDYESDEPLPEPLTPEDLSDTYLQHWYVVGPFPNPGDDQKGFDIVYPPEKAIDLAARYQGCDDREVKWEPIFEKGTPPLGWKLIDLRRHYWKKDYVLAYATTKVVSDREREAVIVASASDGLIVWLNGEKVFSKNLTVRDITLDMYKIPVRLKKGENTILLKICQRWLSWGFYLRLADKDGVPLRDGMRYGLE